MNAEAVPFGRLGAVILAAGLSSRMGGENKLLKAYRGKTLLSHVCETVAGLKLCSVAVVVGRDGVETSAIAGEAGLRVVRNPAYADGMGKSIGVGVRALRRDVAGIFIVLGDMPDIRREDYLAIGADFRTGQIVVPVYRGARGHPVLFCVKFRPELSRLEGDGGGRSICRKYASAVRVVAFDAPRILQDFDTQQDFLNAAASTA